MCHTVGRKPGQICSFRDRHRLACSMPRKCSRILIVTTVSRLRLGYKDDSGVEAEHGLWIMRLSQVVKKAVTERSRDMPPTVSTDAVVGNNEQSERMPNSQWINDYITN